MRNYLKIDNDQETINSVFVEIDKNTTNTKRNLIVGCIYRPPWIKIADFITALTPKLENLKSENKYTLLMGDYNIDISPCIESDLAIEEFKNIFSSHHFFPLINQPPRETKSSNTIIYNIYCNIPCPFDMCDVGILRPYISDHNAIFCILNDITLNKRAYTCYKRNFSNKNISKFKKLMQKESWGNNYYLSTQEAYTYFQTLIDYNFKESFKKQAVTITYRNRYPWMTNSLRNKITEKNKLNLQALKKTDNKELNKTYKTYRNEIISELRNTEIRYYSNKLELHKNDLSKSWKILRLIIGKDANNSKRKLTFNINNTIVTDSEVIANEFNSFFVSIGPSLASNITCAKDPLTYVKGIANSIVVPNVICSDVRTVISSLKNSSPGFDGIPYFVANQCIDNFIEPLTYIINMSFMEGVFPSELKLAKVVPIFKSGDSTKMSNYRAISILSFFSKIFEKLV